MVDNIEGGNCVKYPLKYVTNPNLLKTIKFDTDEKTISETSTCINEYKLYKDKNTNEYGCAKSNENCENHYF